MCKNATATAAALMKAIEPDLLNLLALEGIASTPEGQTAINAYNAALEAVENWVPGTAATEVVEVINAFVQVFNTLPFPTTVKTLVSLITGGIEAVIAVLTANSPAPASPTVPTSTAPDVAVHSQSFYAHSVAAEAETKLEASTGIKLSVWEKARAAAGDHNVAARKWQSEWGKAVDVLAATDAKYAVLKAA